MVLTFSIELEDINFDDVTSMYIKDLMSKFGSDVCINIPSKYTSVFGIYLNFLSYNKQTTSIGDNNSDNSDVKEWNLETTSLDTLLLCFNMESYLCDEKFFMCLMRRSYDMWYEFYPNINKLPDERMVYLHTPYFFIPTKYMDNAIFFKQWLDNNKEEAIRLNRSECYVTIISYYHDDQGRKTNNIKAMSSYVGTQKVMDKHKVHMEWYPNGNIYRKFHYCNEQMHGKCEAWYDNESQSQSQRHEKEQCMKSGQLFYRHNYVNGYRHGSQECWYENENNNSHEQLQHQEYYINGKPHGTLTEWYPSGKFKRQRNYDNGEQYGSHALWYDTEIPEQTHGNIKCRLNFVNDVKHGIQEYWDNDNNDIGDDGYCAEYYVDGQYKSDVQNSPNNFHSQEQPVTQIRQLTADDNNHVNNHVNKHVNENISGHTDEVKNSLLTVWNNIKMFITI